MIVFHAPGTCDPWPQHLAGTRDDCLMCRPPTLAGPFTVTLPHSHPAEVANNDRRIRQLNERVGVIEQIVSDAIPPQPGEKGWPR